MEELLVEEFGIVPQLVLDVFRMSVGQFEVLLNLLEPHQRRQATAKLAQLISDTVNFIVCVWFVKQHLLLMLLLWEITSRTNNHSDWLIGFFAV